MSAEEDPEATTEAPTPEFLASRININPDAGRFIHRVSSEATEDAFCGEEAPAGGFRLVSADAFERHPCPDCLRKLKEKESQ